MLFHRSSVVPEQAPEACFVLAQWRLFLPKENDGKCRRTSLCPVDDIKLSDTSASPLPLSGIPSGNGNKNMEDELWNSRLEPASLFLWDHLFATDILDARNPAPNG